MHCLALEKSTLNTDGFESLPLSEDYEEISASLPELLLRVNDLVSAQPGGAGAVITQEDIHWEDASKIYIETDIYSAGTDDAAPILSMLEEAEKAENVLWVLPISKGNIHLTVDYTIQRPLPDEAKSVLSEEEYEEVMANVGHWHTSTVSFYETAETLESVFQSALAGQTQTGSTKLYLGGFDKMRSVVGLVIKGDKVEQVVPLEERLDDPTQSPQRGRSGAQAMQKGQLYDFNEIARYMSTIHPQQNVGAGGTAVNFPNLALTIVLFSSAALLTVLIFVFWVRHPKANRF